MVVLAILDFASPLLWSTRWPGHHDLINDGERREGCISIVVELWWSVSHAVCP